MHSDGIDVLMSGGWRGPSLKSYGRRDEPSAQLPTKRNFEPWLFSIPSNSTYQSISSSEIAQPSDTIVSNTRERALSLPRPCQTPTPTSQAQQVASLKKLPSRTPRHSNVSSAQKNGTAYQTCSLTARRITASMSRGPSKISAPVRLFIAPCLIR